MLEIAVRDGSAAKKLKLHVGDEVTLVGLKQSQSNSNSRSLRELDRQLHLASVHAHEHWLADDPLVIIAAEGMHLIDSDGNRYLDGVSSLWCNVHGHQVPEIDDAIRRQLDRVAHTTMLGLASEPAILLAEQLMKIVPAV